MTSMFHGGSRQLQDRFDTRRLADRLESFTVQPALSEHDRAFIESRDMFFLATADEHGFPNCSYKGGDPGFVRVVDEHTLAFPNYDGNGMYLSAGNYVRNPHVGMLFIDFEHPRRTRVNGDASVADDDPLLAEYPEAQFVVRVAVRQVFPNCARYIHEYQLVERSVFVPRSGCQTPAPDWKRIDGFADALPAHDPALDPSVPSARSL
jgi:predicted pyridoxine 5'-phosphate oxidase superfamily flavin-nucleotide-binding protein